MNANQLRIILSVVWVILYRIVFNNIVYVSALYFILTVFQLDRLALLVADPPDATPQLVKINLFVN